MLRKKEVYTNITPIPSHIPRQLAIDILHSHSEIITLNPLVLEHKPIKAPQNASADEYYSTWYEITERIQYVPGIGKMGSGKISFNGCFHDMPWGLQTHIYAPMNIDMRNNWRIAGNQPGEYPETPELGIGAPKEGLYLREDIEIKCNITMVSFVKSQMKAASKVLVERLIKKAELLDAGVLHAMMEDGKLKTINPADRTSTLPPPHHLPQPLSPRLGYQQLQQPPSPYRPPTAGSQHSFAPQSTQAMPMELPGDFYHPGTTPETKSHLQLPQTPHMDRDSSTYERSVSSPDLRWSGYQSSISSRPTSYSSDTGSFRSPGLDQKGFTSELPTMNETKEEYERSHAAALRKLESRDPAPRYEYNPQDYRDIPAGGHVARYQR